MGYLKSLEQFKSMDLIQMRPLGFLENILDRQLVNKTSVDNGEGWSERNQCPICKKENSEYQFSKFEFDLVKCKECNTAYFNVIPNNTNDVYSAPQALDHSKAGYLINKDYRKIRFAEERINLIEEYIDKTINGISILDVGCGTGWFLETAKEKGAACYGLELGEQLAQFTSERLEIPIWNCELEELKTDKKFDVITMFDLIEHVKDPVRLIACAKSLLTEKGIILIFTPQFDSAAIQIMKEKSNLIMPAEHLSYFTEETVQYLAKVTDMEIKYYATKGIDLGDLKGLADFEGDFEKSKYFIEMYDILQPSIDASGNGNHLRAILSK